MSRFARVPYQRSAQSTQRDDARKDRLAKKGIFGCWENDDFLDGFGLSEWAERRNLQEIKDDLSQTPKKSSSPWTDFRPSVTQKCRSIDNVQEFIDQSLSCRLCPKIIVPSSENIFPQRKPMRKSQSESASLKLEGKPVNFEQPLTLEGKSVNIEQPKPTNVAVNNKEEDEDRSTSPIAPNIRDNQESPNTAIFTIGEEHECSSIADSQSVVTSVTNIVIHPKENRQENRPRTTESKQSIVSNTHRLDTQTPRSHVCNQNVATLDPEVRKESDQQHITDAKKTALPRFSYTRFQQPNGAVQNGSVLLFEPSVVMSALSHAKNRRLGGRTGGDDRLSKSTTNVESVYDQPSKLHTQMDILLKLRRLSDPCCDLSQEPRSLPTSRPVERISTITELENASDEPSVSTVYFPIGDLLPAVDNSMKSSVPGKYRRSLTIAGKSDQSENEPVPKVKPPSLLDEQEVLMMKLKTGLDFLQSRPSVLFNGKDMQTSPFQNRLPCKSPLQRSMESSQKRINSINGFSKSSDVRWPTSSFHRSTTTCDTKPVVLSSKTNRRWRSEHVVSTLCANLPYSITPRTSQQ